MPANLGELSAGSVAAEARCAAAQEQCRNTAAARKPSTQPLATPSASTTTRFLRSTACRPRGARVYGLLL